MQNQTPEIQAKLLAMQRMMQSPSASIAPAVQPVIEKLPPVVVTTALPVPQPDPTAKPMTQEQREDRMRYHVLSFLVLPPKFMSVEKKETLIQLLIIFQT